MADTFSWQSDIDGKWYIAHRVKRPGSRYYDNYPLDGPYDTRTQAEQERAKWVEKNGKLVKDLRR